jgi:hypothetical protein
MLRSARRQRLDPDRLDVTARQVEVDQRGRCQTLREVLLVGRRHRRADCRRHPKTVLLDALSQGCSSPDGPCGLAPVAFIRRSISRCGRSRFEGIVSKRRNSPYRSGRPPDWIKVKNPDAPAAIRLIESEQA